MVAGGADLVMRGSRDPGLQAERTVLAWNRTGLALLANGLLALRTGWGSQQAAITGLAFALLIAAGGVLVYGVCRHRQLLNSPQVKAPAVLAMVVVTGVSLLACMVGVASMLALQLGV